MFWIKAIVSGLIVAFVSELVKKSVFLGAIFTALPLVSILAMTWMWFEGQETEPIAPYAQCDVLAVASFNSDVSALSLFFGKVGGTELDWAAACSLRCAVRSLCFIFFDCWVLTFSLWAGLSVNLQFCVQ